MAGLDGFGAGDDQIVGLREFARQLNPPVSHTAVEKAIKDGRLADAVVPTRQGTKLRLKAALLLWYGSRVPGNNNRFGEGAEGPEESDGSGVLDGSGERYTAARAELTESQAKRAQLELDEYEGKLHRSEDVEAVWAALCTEFRSQVMAIPSKVAPIIAAKFGIEDIAAIQRLILDQGEEALATLSRFDVGALRKRRGRS